MPGGFGSDSRFSGALGADEGFGSPDLGSPSDFGFGSASRFRDPGLVVLPYSFEYAAYPDEGGVPVRLMGAFPHRGPWRVRITSDAGATLHPVGRAGCYSGVIGQAHHCYTNFFQNALVFVLPPVPIGSYDVWVEELVGGAVAMGPLRIIVGDLVVTVRNPCEQTYGYRAAFPPRFKTGPRTWELEDGSLPEHPTRPLETISRAAGQVLQQSGGTPQTRLALFPLLPDATLIQVQSTLGFPETGEVWVRDRRYSYTSKGPGFFAGVVLLTADDRREIPVLTEVTLHAPALLAS